jgi:hypothetical protein
MGLRDQFSKLHAQLESERQPHVSKWQDLADFICPSRQRFFISDRNKGDRRNLKILDNTATLALRTLKAGMMSGITSPSRPWFRLTTPDPDLAEWEPAKDYLFRSAQALRDLFLKSNLYAKLPLTYGDLGAFGNGAMGALEDDEDVLRCYSFPIGSYWLATDARERVDTFVRETTMTARQLVARFGSQHVSSTVKSLVDRNQGETWVEVVQVIAPNPDFNPRGILPRERRFVSCWYEKGGDSDKTLGESGFEEFPIFAPRWETTGEDVYGDGPGLDALGDIKQLQAYEKKSIKGVDKTIDPPLIGPPGLQRARVSLLPGDITYAPPEQLAHGGLRPIHEVRFDINPVELKQQQNRARIKRAFFEDLFLMMASIDRSNITATEIAERKEEKIQALGPVLEHLNDELLDPLIDRGFNIAAKRGLLPPPPPELQGVQLRVEYISVMANAQRAIAMAQTERFLGFVAGASKFREDALDKIDIDEAIDDVGEQLGVNPRLIIPTAKANETRQARAQAQQQAARAEQEATQAKMARDLAATPTEGDNALTRVADLATGAGA